MDYNDCQCTRSVHDSCLLCIYAGDWDLGIDKVSETREQRRMAGEFVLGQPECWLLHWGLHHGRSVLLSVSHEWLHDSAPSGNKDNQWCFNNLKDYIHMLKWNLTNGLLLQVLTRCIKNTMTLESKWTDEVLFKIKKVKDIPGVWTNH